MQICRRCFKTFDAPRVRQDDIGYTYPVCPYCGYDSLATADKCKACSADIVQGEDFCPDCRDAIHKEMTAMQFNFGGSREFAEVVSDWIGKGD